MAAAAGGCEGADLAEVAPDRAGKAVAGLATGSDRFAAAGSARAKAARSDTRGGAETLAAMPADGAREGAPPRRPAAIAAGGVLGAARRVGAGGAATGGGCATSRRRSP
jgi:hypothetical protein